MPEIAALTTFQYGSIPAIDVIDARFKRELMGFHIAFFSLLAIALVHIVCSLWRPVMEYMRQRRASQSYSEPEVFRRGSKDGSGVDKNGDVALGTVRRQTEDFERARMERAWPIPSEMGAAPGVRSGKRHVSQPDIVEGIAV